MSLAALTLRTQTTGVRPEFEYELGRRRRGVRTKPEALSPRARQINERGVDHMRLQWNMADEGQRVLLRKAFADAKGQTLPMNYTPLGDIDPNAIEVKFVEGSLSIRGAGPLHYSMSVELEEVH